MLFLHSIGHFHPDNILDNDFLESLDIGVDRQWIADRVGIERRRTVLPLDYIRNTRNRDPREAVEYAAYSNEDTAVRASGCALLRAGIDASDIGMVIAGGCSPESTLPAEACRVAAALGITAPAFDLNAGCVSFIAQLHFLSHWQESALPDFVLIVNPENNTRTVDYANRKVAVLWGDGTTAAIVSTRLKGPGRISNTHFLADPSGWRLARTPTGGHFWQDGHAVQSFAVRRTTEMFQLAQGKFGGDRRPSYVIGHQANLRMLESACRRANIPANQHLSCVADFGNCGAAGAPSVLSMHWETLITGSRVALGVVGAGLCWGSLQIDFSEAHHK